MKLEKICKRCDFEGLGFKAVNCIDLYEGRRHARCFSIDQSYIRSVVMKVEQSSTSTEGCFKLLKVFIPDFPALHEVDGRRISRRSQ